MKKLILTLFFLTSLFIFDHTGISVSVADPNVTHGSISNNEIKELADELAELKRITYLKNLVQYIELESEVIFPETFDTQYVEYTFNLANEYGIPIRTAFRLIRIESGFNDTIVSAMGAKGLMQLMPGTRETYVKLLCTDTLKLDRNKVDIYIGMNILKDSYSYWISKGNSKSYSWKLCLASYNAGKGNVIKYQGIPPYKETQEFIAFILKPHSNPQFFANFNKKYENTIKNNS